MTYANQYEEHLASQPDNSRWDGFDRGDLGREEQPEVNEIIVGRMTNGAGQRVVLKVTDFGYDAEAAVFVDGDRVFCDLFGTCSEARVKAIRVGRWWMAGCPA
jgi:hypothetical protein